ncbi:hypothetical protein C0993_000796 [Termitomyces sp. T159_Od127]|nr:hypothetical protein C0993_000796 [Termitomyces sp. T159_Od127]
MLSASTDSSPAAWCSSPALNSSAPQVPPPHICARINAYVTTNPALARPLFDFADHVRSRSYVIRNLVFKDFKSSMLLDEGVERMLPAIFHVPDLVQSHMFRIGDAGDKGQGMFAQSDIRAGDVILVEHPAIVVPYLVGLNVPLADIYASLVDRLPYETRIELSQLYSGKDHSFQDIVHLNALGIQLEVPDVARPELTTHRAVFLNTSKCNHSYCNLPSKDAVLRSDVARTALDQFWSTLPPFEGWCLDTSLPDDMLIKLHVEALNMIRQEGLQVLDGERHVDAIAMCYGALADTEMFRAWIESVRNAKTNADPARALVFAKWLSNPTSFPAWGWKKTFCGRNKMII